MGVYGCGRVYIYCKQIWGSEVPVPPYIKVEIDNHWFMHPPGCIDLPKCLSVQTLSINLPGFAWYSCNKMGHSWGGSGVIYSGLTKVPQETIEELRKSIIRKTYAQQINDYCYERITKLIEEDPENRVQLVDEMIEALNELKKVI